MQLDLFARLRVLRGVSAIFLGAFLLVVGLAGCGGGAASDPLLAARVNGNPISLALYQSVVREYRANADMQGQAPDFQSPGGRTRLNSMQSDALTYLIQNELIREQLAKLKVTIPASELKTARDNLDAQIKQIDQQLAAAPGNTKLRTLRNALTSDILDMLTRRFAGQAVLGKQAIFPTVHARGILVATQAEAADLQTKVGQGSDFAALAKEKSLDSASGAQGGDLGTIYYGQISPEFTAQAFVPGAAVNKAILFITPVSSQFALFQITDYKLATLANAGDATAQNSALTTWIDGAITPTATIEKFVTQA